MSIPSVIDKCTTCSASIAISSCGALPAPPVYCDITLLGKLPRRAALLMLIYCVSCFKGVVAVLSIRSRFKLRTTYCSGRLPRVWLIITFVKLPGSIQIHSNVSGSRTKNWSPYFNVLRTKRNKRLSQSLTRHHCCSAFLITLTSLSVGVSLKCTSNGTFVLGSNCVQNSAMVSRAALTSLSMSI